MSEKLLSHLKGFGIVDEGGSIFGEGEILTIVRKCHRPNFIGVIIQRFRIHRWKVNTVD